MKAKKLLSIITAFAMVATIGVSYALWDSNEGKQTAQMTIGDQMSVAVTNVDFSGKTLAPANTLAAANGAVSTLSSAFNVAVPASLAPKTTLTLSAANFKIGDAELADALTTYFDVTFKEKDASEALANGVDSSVAASNDYVVEITLKDSLLSDSTAIAAIASKTISFDVVATASATPVAP